MAAMLKRLPAKAKDVPQNLRQFLAAEQNGLAVMDGKTYIWTATKKGLAFKSR
jgi:hypothetical protein